MPDPKHCPPCCGSLCGCNGDKVGSIAIITLNGMIKDKAGVCVTIGCGSLGNNFACQRNTEFGQCFWGFAETNSILEYLGQNPVGALFCPIDNQFYNVTGTSFSLSVIVFKGGGPVPGGIRAAGCFLPVSDVDCMNGTYTLPLEPAAENPFFHCDVTGYTSCTVRFRP